MRTANLGPLSVSAQGLGCMRMSQSYGPGDDAESKATLQRALELGVTLFDTADVYGTTGAGGFGANETLLGQTLAGRRDEFVLATKCRIQDILPGTSVRFALSATPDYIRAACDASLRRLQTDHIDLYYLHRVDPQTPLVDSIGAMAGLVAAGKGRGFLTGAITPTEGMADNDSRRQLPRFTDDALQANQRLVEIVRAIADKLGVLPGQVALAWVHSRGDDMVPIPGTKRRSYLEQNVAALDVALTPDDLARLDVLAGTTVGTRY